MTRRRPRGRLLAAGGAVVVAAVAVVLAIALGASSIAPDTGAAALVPADALLYVNVSTDPHRAADARALALLARLPNYPALESTVLARLAAIVSGSPSTAFASEIRPWLGDEAAFAALNTPSSAAGSLIILSLADPARAQAFVRHQGALAAGGYRGTVLLRYASGTELAFVNGYLLLGQDASVRAAIDVAHGAPSLSGNSTFTRAAAGEPDGRVLDAYASAAGLRRVLEPRGGVLGGLAELVDRDALDGVSVSLTPAPHGLTLRLHSVLDPTLAGLEHAGSRSMTPTLLGRVPSGATLALDTLGLEGLAPRVLRAGAVAGIGGGIAPLLARLGGALSAEGIDVAQVRAIFAGESVVAIVPGEHPALVIVSRSADPAAARTTLASLEVPLAQLFAPPSSGPGQAPEFGEREVDGVTAHQLALAPGLQLDYAVAGNLVVLSTSLSGIASVLRPSSPVNAEAEYRSVLPRSPSGITSLLFLDFNQLLHLGEQTGLTHGAALQALAPDLQEVRAVGLTSSGGEADTTAELSLQIP